MEICIEVAKNVTSLNQMKNHESYRQYLSKGVDNLGGKGGVFQNLSMYCGMAFDKKRGTKPLCSIFLMIVCLRCWL